MRPGRLKVACGLIITPKPQAPKLGRSGRARPLDAIEDVIRPALLRPPCLVSFSGGRDSSAILATATAIARRDGLALPIPATYRFPEAPHTQEAR